MGLAVGQGFPLTGQPHVHEATWDGAGWARAQPLMSGGWEGASRERAMGTQPGREDVVRRVQHGTGLTVIPPTAGGWSCTCCGAAGLWQDVP